MVSLIEPHTTGGPLSSRGHRHWLLAVVAIMIGVKLILPTDSSPQASLPAALVGQLASVSGGQAPKMNTPPLIQLDTGGKYYKTVMDGMAVNFKRAVTRANERVSNSSIGTSKTSQAPIIVAGDQVVVQDVHIDGINNPKVSKVHVSSSNLKLHVVFNYKTIRLSGRCSSNARKQQQVSVGTNSNNNKPLVEATNWSTSWSASVIPMIGREHFDMNRVYSSHGHQRLSFNLKECPASLQDQIKAALVARLQSAIDKRLVEVMETVMMHTETLSNPDDESALSRSSPPATAPALSPLASFLSMAATSRQPRRGKRASPKISQQQQQVFGKPAKVLKRTKRQTPCQQGEDLDDYVDQLFRFGTRIVRAMEPIALPNATVELPDYNLKIFLYEGKGTRAYQFRRAKPAWVFCNNETISLGITIEVEQLRVAYKYRVISGYRLLFDGDLEARLSPRIQAQFSQKVQEEDSEEPVQQRIDRIRIFRLGRVQVIIRGLGNLTQSLSMLINSYLNDNQEELQPTFRMLEGNVVGFANRALANVNVPILSVV